MIKIFNSSDDLGEIFARSQLDNDEYIKIVRDIIADVSARGDEAVFEYTQKFDKIAINEDNILVSEEEIDFAYSQVDKKLLDALRRASENIFAYHKRQMIGLESNIYTEGGNKLGWMYRPLQRAGLYIPGGKASYPSSILMCAIPAIVAGVEEVVLVTPNPKNPLNLVAARECGIKKIYKVGGAQAIAGLAFGTKSMPKVDIIAGPGNIFVTLAKKEVFGRVAIDMIAGPSEILVIADDSANAKFVAADMLSQSEHDELAASILLTTSQSLATAVIAQLEIQTKLLDRQEIIKKSLSKYGAIVVCKTLDEALEISDKIAPEHLEICTNNAEELALRVRNAGAVFVGNYSPEPLGDYFAGPSHCLPTSGTARHFSALNVSTFLKKISYISYSKESLKAASADIAAIAESEGLSAHANTVKIRFSK